MGSLEVSFSGCFVTIDVAMHMHVVGVLHSSHVDSTGGSVRRALNGRTAAMNPAFWDLIVVVFEGAYLSRLKILDTKLIFSFFLVENMQVEWIYRTPMASTGGM